MDDINIKSVLVLLWNRFIDKKSDLLNGVFLIKDSVIKSVFKRPLIKSIDDTLNEIIKNKVSIGRYGDGEFKLINNRSITFQRADGRLSKRLKEILLAGDEKFLVCIPDVFQDLSLYTDEVKDYWKLHIVKYRLKWYDLLSMKKVYYNSFISRFYYPFKDKAKCKEWIILIKRIWEERDVVLIEGNKSRLGVGNDLFGNVKSLQRILVPEENAFFRYDNIFTEALKCPKSKLILLAIGPTATVLAYDLHKEGYQALDIGHLDIEYEWLLRQANSKISIENKYVCEVGAGEGVGDLQDKKYIGEIREVIR